MLRWIAASWQQSESNDCQLLMSEWIKVNPTPMHFSIVKVFFFVMNGMLQVYSCQNQSAFKRAEFWWPGSVLSIRLVNKHLECQTDFSLYCSCYVLTLLFFIVLFSGAILNDFKNPKFSAKKAKANGKQVANGGKEVNDDEKEALKKEDSNVVPCLNNIDLVIK